VADQLDFLAGAWLLTAIFDWDWFSTNFTLWVALAAILITPALHLGVNYIGYRLGKKDVPW
jgi:CDP-2,3-bis-(O-geranylgeranyl)-sn-glycerol synthase